MNTWHVPAIIGLLYLPAVYIGHKIMKNREPFKLKGPLICWNVLLAVFSTIGFLRTAPELFNSLNQHGFQHSVCSFSMGLHPPCAAWLFLFAVSKVPELVDTLFLVLKKQRLIFLHVYHHSSVVIFPWWTVAHHMAVTRWFTVMNYGVHSLMYSYYALKGFPNIVRIPRWVSMIITALQTVQMMIGVSTTSAGMYYKLTGQSCDINSFSGLLSLFIYASYLILFSRFFAGAYCSSAAPHHSKEAGASGTKKRA